MRGAVLVVTVVGLLLLPTMVWAADARVAELEREVRELRNIVNTLREEIQGLKSDQKEQEQEIEQLKTVQEDRTAKLGELKGEGYLKVEIGGQYRVMGNSSNFPWHAASITDDQDSQSFANQRFRTWLTVHASEDIFGYLQMEVGHNT